MTGPILHNRICIVAHFGYGALNGGKTGHSGGVERQTSLMAKWLAGKGYPVSYLTWDEGQSADTKIDGVNAIKMCGYNAGIPGFRFFHPRWSSLVLAMRKANADLYYQNCAEYVTGQIAYWCTNNGRKFIYAAASDTDCDFHLPEMNKYYDRYFYRYGLRNADRIIVQTEKQKRMLTEGFGLDSVPLPMPCPGPSDAEYVPPTHCPPPGFRVLWAGRISPEKRLELLLDIGAQMPEVAFDIAGAPGIDSGYSRSVLERARNLKNVTVHGKVARDRMPEMYRQASLLCCTSLYEGFPNTFLEAWSHGLPVVSTFDPDNLIGGRELGAFGSDCEQLVQQIRDFIESPEMWKGCSERARKHYSENYEVDAVMKRYEELFLETLSGSGDSARP